MFSIKRMSTVAGITIIAGVMLGLPAAGKAEESGQGAASARAATAQQQADAARQRAADLARAGGWAYKTGQVQEAEREAARYQGQADEANAEALSCPRSPAPSPALMAARARLDELRQSGGWAYKTGAVGRAEREVQSLSGETQADSAGLSAAQATALARLEELRRSGGWAYKTGAVARAEYEVRALATPRAAPMCEGRQAPLGHLTASAR